MIHIKTLKKGSSAWGLISRSPLSPSINTDDITRVAGDAAISLSCPSLSLIVIDSGGVVKVPGAKTLTSIVWLVVSVPSPLSTVVAGDWFLTVKSPQFDSSCGKMT